MSNWQRVAISRQSEFKTREANSGSELYIEGYFAVFGGYYDLGGGNMERVDRHAFDETIGGDIRALTNHDTTLVLGRSSAGTLKLSVDEYGLYGSILINPGDTDAMNLYARVQRGDVNQCSFGFDIEQQDYELHDDGSVLWTLKKVKLWEVSCCTFPAYEDTAIAARAADRDEINKKLLTTWRERTKNKLKGAENNGT